MNYYIMNLDFKNKKALVRVDFNVPLNDKFEITDDTRIRAALPTIQYILKEGGAVILMSHLGRPQKKLKADGNIDRDKYTLQHLVQYLSELLHTGVSFSPEPTGKISALMAEELKFGEVLLLENTRFDKGEKTGDKDFARRLASFADVYVNDAFGTAHRAHASTTTVANFFEKDQKCFGFLLESELENANRVLKNPARPLTAIVGGAKVSDKILLLEKLIELADNVIVGGGMAYTFVRAQGGTTGKSLVEEDKITLARELLKKAKASNTQLLLPDDSVIADAFKADANTKTVASADISGEWMGLDIGAQAQVDFAEVIKKSKTILWNGPMGVFEMAAFSKGTKAVALAVAEATAKGAFSLVGGGDSVAAVNQMGLADKVSYVSTGGGAMLELLEGKTLPGVAAMLGK